jgi:class 3 adenylate cyclase
MGLHTGEPARTRGEYVGLDVHRAARVCAAGHGGQLPLSRTTFDLVERELPADVTPRDLGEHYLKDLARAERLIQLVIAAGGRRDDPEHEGGEDFRQDVSALRCAECRGGRQEIYRRRLCAGRQ